MPAPQAEKPPAGPWRRRRPSAGSWGAGPPGRPLGCAFRGFARQVDLAAATWGWLQRGSSDGSHRPRSGAPTGAPGGLSATVARALIAGPPQSDFPVDSDPVAGGGGVYAPGGPQLANTSLLVTPALPAVYRGSVVAQPRARKSLGLSLCPPSGNFEGVTSPLPLVPLGGTGAPPYAVPGGPGRIPSAFRTNASPSLSPSTRPSWALELHFHCQSLEPW